ncbi:hypothetical protein [Nocardia cerradoensis]|nr:hypothetical protein [Nocardia cerradoensis]NKY43575.1 hypothetical protein [Nocardia cerradoensis]
MNQLPQRIREQHPDAQKLLRPSADYVAAVADGLRWWAERDRIAPARRPA